MSPVSIGNWEESDIVPNGVKPGQDAWRVVVGERLVVKDPEAKLLRIRDEVVQVVMESLLWLTYAQFYQTFSIFQFVVSLSRGNIHLQG